MTDFGPSGQPSTFLLGAAGQFGIFPRCCWPWPWISSAPGHVDRNHRAATADAIYVTPICAGTAGRVSVAAIPICAGAIMPAADQCVPDTKKEREPDKARARPVQDDQTPLPLVITIFRASSPQGSAAPRHDHLGNLMKNRACRQATKPRRRDRHVRPSFGLAIGAPWWEALLYGGDLIILCWLHRICLDTSAASASQVCAS